MTGPLVVRVENGSTAAWFIFRMRCSGIQSGVRVSDAGGSGPRASWSRLAGNNCDSRSSTGGIERIRFYDDLCDLVASREPATFKPIDDELRVAFAPGEGLKISEQVLFIIR